MELSKIERLTLIKLTYKEIRRVESGSIYCTAVRLEILRKLCDRLMEKGDE